MAYIGQAANVMRTRGLYNARTIHSWLYELKKEPVLDNNGNPMIDEIYNKPKMKFKFVPRKLSDSVDYIIIDESPTVPYRMRKDILATGLPIIATGDINQLPPVRDKPAFLTEGKIRFLAEIMRQAGDSDIPYIADRILKGKPVSTGLYKGVLVIERRDLTDDMIRMSNAIICGYNRTRDYFNEYVRHNILGYHTPLPKFGEKIVCRKNNWNIDLNGINLTNGLVGQVMNNIDVYDMEATKSGYKLFNTCFKPDLMNDTFQDLKCDYMYFVSDAQTRKKIKASPYSVGEKFEYAYATTTHLSQGGQYPSGIYIHEEFRDPNVQRSLDYTGVTRFKKFLIMVLPDKTYF